MIAPQYNNGFEEDIYIYIYFIYIYIQSYMYGMYGLTFTKHNRGLAAFHENLKVYAKP